MLKLTPIKSEKIWGYELWIASTHPNGPQSEFVKACGGEFPLLVKIIQANDTLSIQVHPDDEAAVRLEGAGNRGKTECWYVMDCDRDGSIIIGHNAKSREEAESMVAEGRWDDFLREIPVIASDTGINREIAGERAVFFEQDNSEELAGIINNLLENEEEYKALRERVKGYVPKTWDDTAIAIEKQLLSVL